MAAWLDRNLLLLCICKIFVPFSIEWGIFTKSHELMQIHGLCFLLEFIEMFMFHFKWIEATIVGIDETEIAVLWVDFIWFVHGVLWKKLISHYIIKGNIFVNKWFLFIHSMNNFSFKSKIGKLFNPYSN